MTTFLVGAQNSATPFLIKLLDGPAKGTEIKLEGRALPYRGVSWETEQRTKLTYYGGNPVASQQILGPVDAATTISGIWKDRFLGNGTPQDLVDTFDGLCRAGISVEVVWGDRSDGEAIGNPIVRRGVIKRFKHAYDRVQDIAWEMTFEFRGRDTPVQQLVIAAGTQTTREGFAELSNQLTETLDKIEGIAAAPLNLLSGQIDATNTILNQVQASLERSINFFDATTRTLTSFADIPRDILERAQSLSDASLSSIETFFISVFGAETFKGKILGQLSGTGLLDDKNATFDLFDSLDASAELSAQTIDNLNVVAFPPVLAEVRPPAGTDLRDLALQYYGDPDLWPIIANFNGLSSSDVPANPSGPTADATRAIQIPRRTEGVLASLPQGSC